MSRRSINNRVLRMAVWGLALTAAACSRGELKLATFRCDVTPPLHGHPLIWLTPVETVEDPLWAKGVVLDDGQNRYVLCGVDWCGLCNSSHRLFREKIAAAAGTDPAHVEVHCLHQHTAPYTDGDAQRLLDGCGRPPRYVDFKFLDAVTDRLAAAVKDSLTHMQPFDQVGTGQAKVERVASSRRLLQPNGKVKARMSSTKDPALQAAPEGDIDPLLKTISLGRGGRALVRLHYYATHPQTFYGDPRASADCVGFARERLEKEEGVFDIYFTGCAGDVTLGKYNNGSREARSEIADRLYAGMKAAAAATQWSPAGEIGWLSLPLRLPARSDAGYSEADQQAKMQDLKQTDILRTRAATGVAYAQRAEKLPLDISVLAIGNVRVLHLPGECLIAFQKFAQSVAPRQFVAVAAYGDLGTGYICPMKAFDEGGYEPTASHVAPESELILKGLIRKILTNSNAGRQKTVEVSAGGYVEKVDPDENFRERIWRVPPRAPAESLKTFHLPKGYHIEQAAAEPLVCSCVDLAFDENGRLFVAEMIPYAENNSSAPGSPIGRVVLLEDTHGDGHFDKCTVYAQGLIWPTGLACFDGGVFVAAAPDLWYFKDSRGDGKVDIRRKVLTGFGTTNPNALPNSLRWGLDDRLHGMPSQAGGQLQALQWAAQQAAGNVLPSPLAGEGSGVRGPGSDAASTTGQAASPTVRAVSVRGRDFSLEPRTGQMRLESGGSQFGMAFDQWGRKFESSNSAPIEMVMYEDRYVARNPFLAAPPARLPIWVHGTTVYRTSPPEAWRMLRMELRVAGTFSGGVEGGGRPGGYFTSACGLTIHNGTAWPADQRGQAFVCEGANNLVHRMQLTDNGVPLKADRFDQNSEILTSDEVWFRPIQFCDGPDGALYLVDMYREVFEHPDAVPPSAKKYLDLSTGKDRGRVYRIVPDDFRPAAAPKLGQLSTAELVALLAHPNQWHWQTALRLLYQRQDPAAVGPLEKLAATSDAPLGRMHALYALDGQNALRPDTILPRLADGHPRVREHAVRLAERVLAQSAAVRDKLCLMADDDDTRVRYQLAFTLGELPGPQATAALAHIALHDTDDRWVRLAVLSSCVGRAGDLYTLLLAERSRRDQAEYRALLEALAEQTGLQGIEAQALLVLKSVDGLSADDPRLAQAVVRGLFGGMARSSSSLRQTLGGGGAQAAKVLANLVKQSKAAALDEKLAVKRRVDAVGNLSLGSYAEISGTLSDLLAASQPKEIQLAALSTLARFAQVEAARVIVAAWPGLTPTVRSEALEVLLARREWVHVLLDAVKDKAVGAGQIDPARVQVLLAHPDPQIHARAQQLLAGEKLSRRKDVIALYRPVLKMTGDPAKGKAVFKRECSTCHRLENVGYDLGLPLTTVGAKGAEYILVNVLDPNLTVLPEYVNYQIITKDGRTFTGMIAAETATSITLRRAEGQSDTVLRANIDEMQSTGLSLMPEGLEKQVPQPDMADLIAYLISLK